MRYAMLLLALMLWAPIEIAAQTCQRDLANLSVPRSNYKMVEGAPFEQRVYVYTPQYSAMPFQLWIVEGVYGRPSAADRSARPGGVRQVAPELECARHLRDGRHR